jgi:phage host-nuclease inhibitor protein Gam
MGARVKKVGPAIETREEMEECVRRICLATIRLDELRADLDARLAAIRAGFEERIAATGEELKAQMVQAEEWAEAHRDEFAGKKSIAMVHGTVGFRTGMPRLATLKGWKWDAVLRVLREQHPEFVRTKAEVDKDLLLARRADLGDGALRDLGVEVKQDESFFVDPNRDTARAAV